MRLSWEASSNTAALWNTYVWKSFSTLKLSGHQLSSMKGRACLAGENLDIMNSITKLSYVVN